MKIVFMGTPVFGAVSLQALLDNKFDIAAVYCQPDKPGDRKRVEYCAVKQTALGAGLPVLQPSTLKTPEALGEFLALDADLAAVAAYGKILPDGFVFAPKHGCINVHASLLPRHRGSSPIQSAILCGDKITGVTTQKLAPKLDSGDIIFSRSTEIGEYETSGELYSRLAVIGAELLVKTIRAIENGTAVMTPQNQDEATYTKMLTKEMSPIDWDKTPREVIKHICGLNPWPTATAEIGGKTLKIHRAEYADNSHKNPPDTKPGTVIAADRRGITVAAGGGGAVTLTLVQEPGKKAMSAADYLRGHPLNIGTL